MDLFDTLMHYLIYFPSPFLTQENTLGGNFPSLFSLTYSCGRQPGFLMLRHYIFSPLSVMVDCCVYLKGNVGSISLLDVLNENIGLVLRC